MTGSTPTSAKLSFNDANGQPLVGGTLTVYLAGTVTPTSTWQDLGQTVLNTNPIILDARGECTVFLDDALTYKFFLQDSDGATIWTVDNIISCKNVVQALVPIQAQIDSMQVEIDNLVIGVTGRFVFVDDYGDNITPGTTDMTAAINAAIAAAGNGGEVRFLNVAYRTTSEISLASRVGVKLTAPGIGTASSGARIVGAHTGRSIVSFVDAENCSIEGICLQGDFSSRPIVGLLLGATGASLGNHHSFMSTSIKGFFQSSGLYNIGSSNNTYIDCDFTPDSVALSGLFFSFSDDSASLVGITVGGLSNRVINNNIFIGGSHGAETPGVAGTWIRQNQQVGGIDFLNCALKSVSGFAFVHIDVANDALASGPLRFLNCSAVDGSSATNGFYMSAATAARVIAGLQVDIGYLPVTNIFNATTVTLEAPVLRTTATPAGAYNSSFDVINNGTLHLHTETTIAIATASGCMITSNVTPTIGTLASGSTINSVTYHSVLDFTPAGGGLIDINILADDFPIYIVRLISGSNYQITSTGPTPLNGYRKTVIFFNTSGSSLVGRLTVAMGGAGFTLSIPDLENCPDTFKKCFDLIYSSDIGGWVQVSSTPAYF